MNRLLFTFGVLWCCLLPVYGQGSSIQFLEDEAEPQFNITFSVKPPDNAAARRGGLTVVFDYRSVSDFYALDFTSGSARLRAVAGGKARVLTSAPLALTPSNKITLQRRPWLMQVVADDRVVLTAYDAALTSGRIGIIASGGWNWQTPRVQPVDEAIYFTDDFTRGADEAAIANEWKADAGWELTSSSDNITRRNVEMSANPFSYRVKAPEIRSFAQAGRWFWDNYAAQVSVRPGAATSQNGSVALAVYVRDSKNYLAFIWSAAESGEARRLVRVVDGKTTVLAKAPGAYLPRQWYRLGMRTSPGTVEAFIDGMPVLRARENAFGQGAVALIAEDIVSANFDDVRVESYPYYAQDFSADNNAALAGGAWENIGGAWRAEAGVLRSAPLPRDGGATRVLVAGANDWDGYEIAASGRAGVAGSCGVMGGYRDDKNYTVFRWAGPDSKLPFRGRQQLLRYHAGKAFILSDGPATVFSRADTSGFTRVRLRFSSGVVTVYSGDEIVAQAADEGIAPGKPGLWAQSTLESSFRDIVLLFPPEPEKPRVAPKMEDDVHMVGWASPSGEWPPAKVAGRLEHWNTGDFYGDFWVEVPWRSKAYSNGSMEVALRARRDKFASGYILRCAPAFRPGLLRLTLLRGDTTLKQVDVDLKELPTINEAPVTHPFAPPAGQSTPVEPAVTLRVELEGNAILVRAGERPVLSFLAVPTESEDNSDGISNANTCVAVRSLSFEVPAKELRAFSVNRDDYTFTEAPIDWYAPQGDWSVFSRWPCYSDWSFFGGKGLAPVLWNKRVYRGDIVVEMYAHNQMDLPKEIGYSRPGDLNITIAGDGKNPNSGYSFIVGGWSNTRTRVYKGTQMVAEKTGNRARFPRPINHNPGFHKRWYYIRAEARHTRKDGQAGVQLRLLLDDDVLAEYFDPAPLPALTNGGRVALWTLNSAIMVARAKIESAVMGGRVLPDGLLDASANTAGTARSGDNGIIAQPVVEEGVPASVVSPAETGWTVRNPVSGGHFAMQLTKKSGEPWKIGRSARLEMELSLPPEAKIDCYLMIDGVPHLITLAGAERPDARVKFLDNAWNDAGSTPATENGWHRATVDIGAALQKLYPGASLWDVQEIVLGALHGDDYRWAGFNGNPLGTSYQVRSVRLSE